MSDWIEHGTVTSYTWLRYTIEDDRSVSFLRYTVSYKPRFTKGYVSPLGACGTLALAKALAEAHYHA